MPDAGHIMTDEMLEALEKDIQAVYTQAVNEMNEKVESKLLKYSKNLEKKKADLASNKITQKEFDTWTKNQVAMMGNTQALRDTLAQDLVNADRMAMGIVNDTTPEVFALNYNFGTYQIEKTANINTSFVLYNKDTVNRLIAENPDLLPKPKVNIAKDLAWNKKHIGNAVTQGILQGENSYKIAKRLQAVADMDNRAAIRNARTMVTNAQSAGRVRSYKRALDMGIKVKHKWKSIHDHRTRDSHVRLDGEVRDLDEAFSNGLMFPGDANGPGFEVYNCRCRVIPVVGGKDFNEKRAKEDYEKWEEEQDMPDALIQSAWGDKKYGHVYNLLKQSKVPGHGADANNFFNALKELGEKSGIGKPPQVWQAYLTGQLDAKDLKTFEDIIKKYLPKQADNLDDYAAFLAKWKGKSVFNDDVPDGVLAKMAGKGIMNPEDYWKKYLAQEVADPDLDNVLGWKGIAKTADKIDDAADTAKIAKEAQDSLGALKLKAGNLMDVEQADNYKVNPFYEEGVKATTQNCQTSAFAYECRRQGYDVIALPKYGLSIDDPEFKDILKLQSELGQNARLGWINKTTGQPATVVLEQTDMTFLASKADMLKDLENAVGSNGERYIMGVRWKKKGSHAINVDRTPDGKLRIIDNQRGPLEKNTWVGQEVEEYLENVKNIKHLTRVDDCVPKAEYFNKIVVDASKVKTTLPGSVSGLKPGEYAKVSKAAKAANEKPAIYYTKWKAGLIDNSDLDDIVKHYAPTKADDTLKVAVNTKIDEKLAQKTYAEVLDALDDNIAENVKDIVEDVAHANNMTHAEYWSGYANGKIIDPELDDLLKDVKLIDKTTGVNAVKKTTSTIDFDLIKNKTASGVWKELNANKAGGGKFWSDITEIANKYGEKPGELWKKYYLTGKLDPDDVAKIEGHLVKIYSKADKADDALDAFMKKWKGKDLYDNDISVDEMNKIVTHIQSKGIIDESEVEKYFIDWANGKVKDDDVAKILGYKADKVDDDFLNFKKTLSGDIFDDISDGTDYSEITAKIPSDGKVAYWAKYIAGEIDNPDLDDLVKKKLYKKADDFKAALPDKMTDLDLDQFDEAKKIIKNYYNSPDAGQIEAHYSQWKKGLLEDDNLDALFGKTTTKVDDLAEIKKTMPTFLQDPDMPKDIADYLNTFPGTGNAHWKKYLSGEVDDPKLDDLLKKYDGLPDWVKDETFELIDADTGEILDKIEELEKIKNMPITDLDNMVDKLTNDYFALTKDEAKKILKESGINIPKKKEALPENLGKFVNNLSDSNLADKIEDHVSNKLTQNYNLSSTGAWKKYISGEIVDSDLDELIKKAGYDVPEKKTATSAASASEVDLFALQGKSMSQVFKELKEDGLNNKFYNELKKYGKPSDVFEKYLNGELSEDVNKKIDDILIKKYSKGGQIAKTVKTAKTTESIDNLGELAKTNKDLYDDAFAILKNEKGSPGTNWKKYLNGEINNPDLDKILVKHNLATDEIVEKVEKHEKLETAQDALKKAEEDLKAAKKALKDNVDTSTKWSGIWKENVTLDDYASKKSAIAGKKQYYYDQIEELEHCIDDPDSWQFKKYGGEDGINKKILEFETYIDDLDEYDQLGKYAEKYYEDIKKAEDLVSNAKKEVQALTPVGEAFTEERKANAVWVKEKSSSSSEYKKADKYYETVASKVHGAKTSAEHDGYYHYTWGSGPFNEPLYMNKNIDANGYGDKIRGLTSLCEKSTYGKDVWAQSAQDHITIEAFLGIKPGTLNSMTVEEAQQFVGVQNEIPQFISTAINKSGGSYNPGNMTVNIYCPSGSEILYVRSDGHFGKSEHELILQRGGTYKLTRIYKGIGTHGHNEWIVDLELHPEVGYDKRQQIK